MHDRRRDIRLDAGIAMRRCGLRTPGLLAWPPGPDTNDVLKCVLKPLNRAEYAVSFTDAQWTRLTQAFPQGVCDFTKAGVAQRRRRRRGSALASGPGGVPLGPPPESD